MKQAKWFRSATMMAFLALIALFVSPVFAMSCCCGTPPHSSSRQTALNHGPNAESSNHSCCVDEIGDRHSKLDHHDSESKHCVTMTTVCSCDHSPDDQTFVTSNPNSFVFSPVVAALPQQVLAAPYIEDVRQAAYVSHAARPRSPDQTPAAGRAPPILALS